MKIEKLIPAAVFGAVGIIFITLPQQIVVKTPFGSTLEYEYRLIFGAALLAIAYFAYKSKKKSKQL